jgi:hypothetical protein
LAISSIVILVLLKAAAPQHTPAPTPQSREGGLWFAVGVGLHVRMHVIVQNNLAARQFSGSR